nr:hypothetical protein [uncultured Schaedlerella sp.]
MRLIDADNFKTLVTAVSIADGYDAGFVNEFCKFIDSQPTAYDVDRAAERLTEYEETIDKLAAYVVEKASYCPVVDYIDRYKIRPGCVGLRKPGCKECMLKHMEDFKIPPRITYVKIYEKD